VLQNEEFLATKDAAITDQYKIHLLLCRTRCFFSSNGRNDYQYSFCLPTEWWPGWVGLGGLTEHEWAHKRSHISVITQFNIK